MTLGRFTIALVVVTTALTIGTSIAQAANELPSDTLVDDYFRDQPALTSDTLIDDYFRDQPALTSDTLIDDYFRDAPTVVSSGARFDWGDFGIGVAAAAGAMLVLAGLGIGVIAARQTRGGKTRPTGAA
jgi:hypothetical protein